VQKGVANKEQEASIAGAVAAAHYIRAVAPAYGIPVVLHTDHCAKKLLPWLDGMLDADEAYFKEHGEPLFSSHMIDLSEEEVAWNIETTAKYLKRAAPMKQWLEMVRCKRRGRGMQLIFSRKSASREARRMV
jgi:fructose-bisphosphate aldolase class II